MSPTTAPTVYEAVTAVMAEVQKIGKDGTVTEGPARFSFRGVDQVVTVVGPVFRKHGVIIVPHEVVAVDHERYVTGNNKPMHGVTITIRWRFYGPAGDFIEAASAGQASDSGDKAVPKAHSVAYRTVLLQALCIPTDEPDPDSQVHERVAVQMASDEAIEAITDRIEALDDEHKAQLRAAWTLAQLPKPLNLTAAGVPVALSLIEAVTEAKTEDPA